ncbi:MAG: hypothetical protein PF447_02975 [Spirochaetaceae bacterium]|jgi:hypothetical protein|nr:hypothetical protein [Spirochaetaceae bacterium]
MTSCSMAGIHSITEKKVNLKSWGPFIFEGNVQQKECRIFDSQGSLSSIKNHIGLRTFYWEGDFLIRECQIDSSEEIVEEIIYHLDSRGFCTLREIKRAGQENHQRIKRKAEQGGLIVIEQDGSTLRAIQRDNNDRVVKEIIYTGENPDRIIHYSYDQQGRLIQKDQKEAQGVLRNREIRSYGDGGEMILQRWEDGQGHNIRELHYSYPHGENALWLLCQVSLPHPIFKGKLKPIYRLYREINFYPQQQPLTVRQRESQEQIPLKQGENSISSIQPSLNQKGDTSEEIEEIEFSNGNYSGPLKEKKMHGRGEFRFNDGSIYVGEFKEGHIQGNGEMEFADGRIYRGGFQRNQMQGQGQCSWPNGDHYKGTFNQGEMHGPGEFRWADGTLFRGIFEHNKPSEQGMLEPPSKKMM